MSRASGTRCVSFAFQPELIGILQVLTDGINLFDPFELTAVLRRCVEPFVKLGTGFGALVPIQSYNPFAGLLIDGHMFVFAPSRKSTRLTPVTNAHLVCRLLLEKKNTEVQ